MSVLAPHRGLVAELPVIESFGVPEIFIDGTVAIVEPDVTHIICYVERIVGDRIERHEVLRCHMGNGHYRQNLLAALARMSGRGH